MEPYKYDTVCQSYDFESILESTPGVASLIRQRNTVERSQSTPEYSCVMGKVKRPNGGSEAYKGKISGISIMLHRKLTR